MRVAVDATPLLGRQTGVGYFVAQLVDALSATDEVELIAYAITWRGRDELARVLPGGVCHVSRPMAARPLHAIWQYADLPRIQTVAGRLLGDIDVVHGTNYVVPPSGDVAALVTIHDMTPWTESGVAPAVAAYRRLVGRALARGAHVHVVSRFVGGEVSDVLGVDEGRIHVVASGVPAIAAVPPWTPPDTGFGDYLLSLGTLDRRKDIPTLIAAWDDIAEEIGDLGLVIAGGDGTDTSRVDAAVASSGHRERIVRLPYVDDRMRAALLRGAAAFVYPSSYEGFGFPPLEAMSVGVPVVSSDAGALTETGGEAARYFHVGDSAALADAVVRVLSDQSDRTAAIDAGRRRAGEFRWERTAAGLIDVYSRIRC